MARDQRSQYGGTMAVFIVVGVLLTAILLGSVYYYRQQGTIARQSDDQVAAEEVDTPTSENTSDGVVESGNDQTDEDLAVAVDLPKTGPSQDIMVQVVAIFGLTASTTGYFASRKQLELYL